MDAINDLCHKLRYTVFVKEEIGVHSNTLKYEVAMFWKYNGNSQDKVGRTRIYVRILIYADEIQ